MDRPRTTDRPPGRCCAAPPPRCRVCSSLCRRTPAGQRCGGAGQTRLASLTINYRTPQEVMTEAEPVIRAVLPDANVPASIRSTGLPVLHRPASDLGPILGTWLTTHADGTAAVIGDPALPAAPRIRSLTPPTGHRTRIRPGHPHQPEGVRHRHRRNSRPLRHDDPGDPATRHPHQPLGMRSRVAAVRRAGTDGWTGFTETGQ
jgi:hypothetical protein